MKPQYFVVEKKESNLLWKVYIDWLNKTYKQEWDGNGSLYYGYDGKGYDGKSHFKGTLHNDHLSNFQNNPTLLTLDQWKELFIDVLPEKWYLKLDEDNLGKADEWRKTLLTTTNLFTLDSNCTLLSKHLTDPSCYYGSNILSRDYKDYQEITTEQFIKHVYNPKFNVMEEYVIKNLTLEHGAEIIQHFKDLGVNTKGKMGDTFIYYGVINGEFDNYSLSEVQLNNTPIRELPKKELKMYSIKEVETNDMLVVYLDSQEEWNKLKTITDSINTSFYGQHCYNLYSRTWSNTSSKTDPGFYKNSTIITINQIKELNMEKELKMYSIKEVEIDENLVVYLDSQEEWNKLNSITIRVWTFCGKHCYSLNKKSTCNYSSKIYSGSYKNSTIITINQIKELNMENKIIGYKLIKPEYKDVALKICMVSSFGSNPDYDFTFNSIVCEMLKEAGVLDLWCEPVYKTIFNVGDWVYIEKAKNGAEGANFSVGQITEEKNNAGLLASEGGINVKIDSSIWKIGELEDIKLRLATGFEILTAELEILANQEKNYTLGIDLKFNISVRGKRAFYRDEDVTETLLDFQKNFKHLLLPYKGARYTWNFKDLIISSVGCITKEFYLSQVLSIDLA